jgi:hypothetical protein
MKDASPYTYRSLSTRIHDHPRFQRETSAHAKLAYLTLRGCQQRGRAGIWRFYPEVLTAQLHPLTPAQVDAALQELEAVGYIEWDREAGVLWICEALTRSAL